MSSARHLIRLLAATIVMIAAGLGASVVQAHEAHGQPRAAHVQAVHVHAAHVQAGAATVSIAAGTTRDAAMRAEPDARDACGPCCPTCMACCHSVLMPAVSTDLPSPARPVRIAASAMAMPPGLAPEALPRPPRPLA